MLERGRRFYVLVIAHVSKDGELRVCQSSTHCRVAEVKRLSSAFPSSSLTRSFKGPTSTMLCGRKTDSRQKSNPCRSAAIDERYVTPIDRVPLGDIPENLMAERSKTDQVPQVCDQKPSQHCLPDAEFFRCSEDEGFVDSEEQVQIAQLPQYDLSSEWYDTNWGRRAVGEVKVGFRMAEGIKGSQEAEKGLNVQQEDSVIQRNSTVHHCCCSRE